MNIMDGWKKSAVIVSWVRRRIFHNKERIDVFRLVSSLRCSHGLNMGVNAVQFEKLTRKKRNCSFHVVSLSIFITCVVDFDHLSKFPAWLVYERNCLGMTFWCQIKKVQHFPSVIFLLFFPFVAQLVWDCQQKPLQDSISWWLYCAFPWFSYPLVVNLQKLHLVLTSSSPLGPSLNKW